MDFPHLDDTRFPNLDNVNVYSFKNTFDYTRWVPNTRIRLVNVLWNSDYNDAVVFDDDAARDAWFDSIDDFYDTTLTVNTRLLPDGTVKVPIPFDVAVRYNYMYIDFEYATSASNMIDYESNAGMLRWYFFVNDIQYSAPNTTYLHISLDTWTNYINDVEIKYMVLERGHAPVAFSDVDSYLADPINNNKYLLASDIDFGHADICNTSEFIPVGNGDKYLCFASTCTPDLFDELGIAFESDLYKVGNITYSDVNARYGYQLKVNGFTFGNGKDYSNVKTPAGSFASNGNMIPNNLSVYAISLETVYRNDFIERLIRLQPSFMYTVQGCFMVDSDMIIFGAEHHLAGFTVYEVIGNDYEIGNIKFNKDDFKYDSKYADFAKLYTFPYAYIEMTDNNGKSVEVKIEETSTIKAYNAVSLAFPYVNNRVYFDGIGGVGSSIYSWKSISAVTATKEMLNSDWFKYCFDMDIPCYALFMDGETAYSLTNFNRSIKNAARSALVNYHNSARQANTARANAVDLADTANTNVYADANTLVANMANTTACESANTNATIATNNANMLVKDAAENNITLFNIQMTNANCVNASNACSVATDIQNERTSSMAVMNGLQTVVNSLAMAPATGGLSLMCGIGSAGLGMASAGVVVNANNADVANQIALNRQNMATSNTNSNSVTVEKLSAEYSQVANNNSCMATHTANTNAKNTQNTANTAGTMKANADRTENTQSANANYTREVAILNAKEILENTRNGYMAALYDARNARPVEFGAVSGNPAPDYYGTRGIQIKLRTMNDSELAQTGDFFARYGYALNQNWNIQQSGFNLMKNFTYWKASEIWVDDRRASNNIVQLTLERILKAGVTVWSDPDKIGKVTIYDN